MQFNEEQVAGPSGQLDRLEAKPTGSADLGRLYRSLARTYAGEIQRHQVRRKRVITAVVALGVTSFFGLMAFSYWASL
jgi:hypothetical protein